MFRAGDIPRAVAQYKAAVEADPDLADAELAGRLGIDAFHRIGSDRWPHPGRLGRTPAAGPTSDRTAQGQLLPTSAAWSTVKEEIRLKIIHPLTHPELYKAYGKPIGGGILMYGPPGCGKTHLARATAGEIKAGVHRRSASTTCSTCGSATANATCTSCSSRPASNRPCVLFFDEVDALGASRTDMRHSAGRQLINQFLAEMDGVNRSTKAC